MKFPIDKKSQCVYNTSEVLGILYHFGLRAYLIYEDLPGIFIRRLIL